MVLDIFPNKKEENKLEVTADSREKESLVIAKLNKANMNVNIKHLKVGDYLIEDTIVERKTVKDLVSSMINKRLNNQLKEIQQYPQYLLLVEGNYIYHQKSNVHPNAIRGFILSILLDSKIPIIFTENEEDTANFLKILAKRKREKRQGNKNIRAKKKIRSKKEKMQYILEGFESIGPKTAKKLLKKYKTINKIVNAPQKDLKNLIGKKAETFKIVDEEIKRET